MKSHLSFVVACAALISIPLTVRAQKLDAPFADGAVLVDSDYAAGGESGTSRTAGVGAGLGIHLTDRVSLRLGVEIPERHADEDLAGSWTSRTIAYSLLLSRSYRQNHRVELAILFGLGVMATSDSLANRTKGWEFLPTQQTSKWLAPVMGFEAPVWLTHRVMVVPQFRFHSELIGILAGNDQARPLSRFLIGLRWRL